MSWSATDPHFNVHQFLDHLRATKPPFYCPYPECQGKVYKSFSGMQTHLNRTHAEAMALSGGGDGASNRSPEVGAVEPGVGQRGLPWTSAQTVVEVDHAGSLWRLPIDESLQISVTKDADLPPESRSSAVEAAYRQSLRLPLDQLPKAEVRELSEHAPPPRTPPPGLPSAYLEYVERSPSELDKEVEYDMDEEDYAWLAAFNKPRSAKNHLAEPTFEALIDGLEKESHWETKSKGGRGPLVDEDAVCCVCLDGECQNANVILFCDMCNLAVHQECYGVPYVPEGQWLCRRCQLSPSVAVECALCPNKGGAFKQTAEGKWVHVICAIWVPEVHFANTVFLEPVEGLDTVPAARWKLKCIVCKQRGLGACIQCNKPSCYTPFHVTCAQSAGVYMKVEPVSGMSSPGGTPYGVRKFIYCDIHAPAPLSPKKDSGVSMSRTSADNLGRTPGAEELAARKHLSQQKIRKARKLLAASRNSAPRNIAIPAIPLKTLEQIAGLIPLQDADKIIGRVFAYWRLKRESRFGVPLLRRLQSQKSKLVPGGSGEVGGGGSGGEDGGGKATAEERRELRKVLAVWRGLRQDLERVRLLCELLRKREKLKVEHVGLGEELVERLFRPTGRAFVDAVEKMMEKDRFQVFATAVKEEDVPGYHAIIPNPMDLGTMHTKAKKGQYKSWNELHDDFKLMIDNCTGFNKNNATFYKYGLRMKRLGMSVIKAAKDSAAAGLSGSAKDTGLGSLTSIPLCLSSNEASFPPPDLPNTADERDTPPPSTPPTTSKSTRKRAAPVEKTETKKKAQPPAKKPKLTPAFKEFRGAENARSPELSSAASSEEAVSETEGAAIPKALLAEPSKPSPSQAEEEEEGSEFGYLVEHPRPLDMVWAPFVLRRGCRVWLPAVVMDPGTPAEGLTVQGVELEAPPAAVRARDPNTGIQDEHEIRVLVRFFDAQLTWDWVAFIELFHFIGDERIDKGRLDEPKKPADKALVHHAFDRAKVFWCRMNGEEVPEDVAERVSPGKRSRCSLS